MVFHALLAKYFHFIKNHIESVCFEFVSYHLNSNFRNRSEFLEPKKKGKIILMRTLKLSRTFVFTFWEKCL
jgi:hypothetical protein